MGETRGHGEARGRELLDHAQEAPEIATHARRHVRDVAIDEAGDVGLVGRDDTRLVSSTHATREVLHDDVLPGLEADELRADALGYLVAARTDERDNRARSTEEAERDRRLEDVPPRKPKKPRELHIRKRSREGARVGEKSRPF